MHTETIHCYGGPFVGAAAALFCVYVECRGTFAQVRFAASFVCAVAKVESTSIVNLALCDDTSVNLQLC